jgi:hypothetical protein
MPESSRKPRNREDENEVSAKKSFFDLQNKAFFFIALAVTGLLSTVISVSVTLLLLPNEPSVSYTEEDILQTQTDIVNLQTLVEAHANTLTTMAEKDKILETYLRHSSATSLKNIMIDQERNIQSFLLAMKAGVRDLSLLVKGTGDWQQDYDYQLEIAIQHSVKREEILALLKTGDPNTTP